MTRSDANLPAIPVVDTGPAFPAETLEAGLAQAHALLDGATKGVPRPLLHGLDRVSRRWLLRQHGPWLDEIDALAQRLGRPGGHFLSVNYEWGCTVRVAASSDARSAQLVRTLDWFTPGLGRHVMAARVAGEAGPFVTLTWPGFVGVLQAMAPGRFSASINQAPLRRSVGGLFAIDWMAAKARTWRASDAPPVYVLRRIFETARDYAQARRMMIETPLAAPVTFSLAGLAPHETCVIERDHRRAHVIDGAATAANHWQALDHGAHARGIDSRGRHAAMDRVGAVDLDTAFSWLAPPILNPLTRLGLVADAARGRIVVQGFEEGRPATQPLELSVASAAATGMAAE